MEITSLDHMVITTFSLEKCLYFYETVLGLTVECNNNRYALKFGNQKINIHRQKGEFLPAATHITYGSQDFCLIATGTIESIKEEVEAKGYPVELGIVNRTGALGPMRSIYLRDPDGNLVEVATYV